MLVFIIVNLGIIYGGILAITIIFLVGVIYLVINGIRQKAKRKEISSKLLPDRVDICQTNNQVGPESGENTENELTVCPHYDSLLEINSPNWAEQSDTTEEKREFMEQSTIEHEEESARKDELDKCPICGSVVTVECTIHADGELEYRNFYEGHCIECNTHMTRTSDAEGFHSAWVLSKPSPSQELKLGFENSELASHVEAPDKVEEPVDAVSGVRSRILHIDDDPTILEFVSDILEARGFDVTTAMDGASGLKAFEETSPDLVILDIMMPIMDGVAVCRRVREWSDVPIIMLTGRNTDEGVLTLMNLGANDYIAKPFSMDYLITRIQMALDGKSEVSIDEVLSHVRASRRQSRDSYR